MGEGKSPPNFGSVVIWCRWLPPRICVRWASAPAAFASPTATPKGSQDLPLHLPRRLVRQCRQRWPAHFLQRRKHSHRLQYGLGENQPGAEWNQHFLYLRRLGRLRSIQPGSASGAAWTKIWFGTAINSTQPARAEVRELPNGSLNNNDALTEKRYRWDGLGRLDQERVSLPPGSGSEFSDRYHFYDGQGRRYATTTWGGSQATGLQQFDAFDRPRVIYPPDANTTSPEHAIELSYEGFRRITRTVAVGTELDEDGVVVENPISRTEEYDALGRLVAVAEPSGSGGANITTTYEYDLKDRLIGITMPVGGGQQQARSWTYDSRGFLTSECHPEKGGINGGGLHAILPLQRHGPSDPGRRRPVHPQILV